MIRWTFLLMLLTSSYALACEFDSDCAAGSHCVRQGGQMSGICASRTDPGGPVDRTSDPFQRANPSGQGCTSDTQCNFGCQCQKAPNQVYGVCTGGIGVNVGGMHSTH